ncbi:hypothetical protein EON66_02690 [archaeon]|nr:MAG: hypothetical protein EON66_02690 [archaeon]
MSAVEGISRILEEREALALLLEKTLTDLRDGHFSALSTFVDRENAARQKMRAVASQEEEVLKEVERLTSVLKEEDEKHALDMESKRKELEELKEKLRKLKVDTTLTLRYARKEAAAKTESMSRAYTAEEAELMRNIEELRKKAEVEAFVHEQTMDVLKKGKWVSGWGGTWCTHGCGAHLIDGCKHARARALAHACVQSKTSTRSCWMSGG